MICATNKVVLASVTLVDYSLGNHYMEFEPRLSQETPLQIVGALRADNQRAIARKNVLSRYVFSRVTEHGHADSAQNAMLDFAEVWPRLSGVATISNSQNSQGYTLADAGIADVSFQLKNYLLYTTITLVGGKFTVVAP